MNGRTLVRLGILVLAAGVVTAAGLGVARAGSQRAHGPPDVPRPYPSDVAAALPSTTSGDTVPAPAAPTPAAATPAAAGSAPATARSARAGDTAPAAQSSAPARSAQANGPIAVAVAFTVAEWTSDGTGGLHALADRTAAWASPRLRSEWARAPDPPAPPGRAARARILDAVIVDPHAAPIVVQVDVERTWTSGPGSNVDSVPHVVLLTMACSNGLWTVDDVAAVA